MEPRVLFVAGTAPGVGKTTFAAGLLARLSALGIPALGMKPVETGCSYGTDHDLVARDGPVLRAASTHAAPPLLLSPYRFAAALPPAWAAASAGIGLTLSDLIAAVEAARERALVLVVEGPWAALSPIADDGLTLDLAARAGATLALVVPEAPGAESHALTALEAAERRGVPVGGLVLNHAGRCPGHQHTRTLTTWSAAPLLLELPASDPPPDAAAVAARLEASRGVERLLERARDAGQR